MLLYSSVGAAMTNYHRLGGLNNEQLFCTVLEPEKSKVKVLVDLVSGKSTLPRFQAAMFLLYPHMRWGALLSFS